MLKKFLKHIYFVLAIFSTIGGVISFYYLWTEKDEYSLSLYLKSYEKIIERNDDISGLRLTFDGIDVESLYVSNIQLKNTGRRALTKEHIYEPVTIKIDQSNKLLKVVTSSTSIKYNSKSLYFSWDLFNPNDTIDAIIFSQRPLQLNISQKIREIIDVQFIDEIKNPPTDKRLGSISLLWLLLVVVSILITIDPLLLILQDIKLQKILNLANTLRNSDTVDLKEFLDQLSMLYERYYDAVPILLIKPKLLIDILSSHYGSSGKIYGQDLIILRQDIIKYVIHGNLYNLRACGLFVGPLLFGFCIIRVAWALIM